MDRLKNSGVGVSRRAQAHLGFIMDRENGIDTRAAFKAKCAAIGISQQRAFDSLIDQFTRGVSHRQLREGLENALGCIRELYDGVEIPESVQSVISDLEDKLTLRP